jgi:hypothetical protein
MDNRQELIRYIQNLELQLARVFGNTYAEVLRLAEVRAAIASGETFTWKGNPAAERKLMAQLRTLAQQTSVLIRNGITGSWQKGEGEAKDTILDKFGKGDNTDEVNTTLEQAVKDHRGKGMTAHGFATRKQDGLSISSRVWNLTGNAKQELEAIIQNGILEGKGADEISRSLTKYLNEPEAIFRRVRNKETGELELSKAAKDNHPGQGVYRSAFKNARRLAVTEMNAAYRRAEWESYQQNPLIVGYRIELSNNHTVVINGKVRPLHDICDDLVGVYPKTFLWTGWHPQCRCRMVPILISDAEFTARAKARAGGKLDEWKPKTVTEPPKAFFDWVEKNRERLERGKHTPYWIRDNFKDGDIKNGLKASVTAIENEVRKAQAEPAKPEPAPVPQLKPQDHVPEPLKRGRDYFAGKELEFDNDFFALLDETKPITLHIRPNAKGSFFEPGPRSVTIAEGQRAARSDWHRTAVIYHEYGHAIDWQRGLHRMPQTTEILTRWRKTLGKKTERTIYTERWDALAGGLAYTRQTVKISTIAYIDKRLDELSFRIFKTPKATFERLGVSRGDLLEQIGAVRDAIMAINPNYGAGHTKSYFRNSGLREAEFLAHAFENTFNGNPIFKKYLPELYDEMTAYIKALK